MGIQSLLPFFEQVQKNVSLKDFAGKRVAVDGNVWLHRGAFTCAQDLALNQPTFAYVNYFMKQIDLLLFYKVDPVIVFDGDTLPIKNHTNQERQKKRQEAKDLGMEHLRHGRLEQAKEAFQKAVTITPTMTAQVIKALTARNIKYIQAPYEADPQLASLCKQGYVSAVISEDSDLLVHGCPTVLYKLNSCGDAIQINYNDLFCNLGNGFKFTSWDATKLRHWCILSGCDYLPSAPGVGLKMAYKYLNHYKTANNVIKFLQRKGKINGTSYEDGFAKANDAFLHQLVYVPGVSPATHLTPLPNGKTLTDYPYLGKPPTASPSASTLSSADPSHIPTAPLITNNNNNNNNNNTKKNKEPTTPSDTHMAKKRKTTLGCITNTYNPNIKVSNTRTANVVKNHPSSRNTITKHHFDDNKENIAPWRLLLFTLTQNVNSRRSFPIRIQPAPSTPPGRPSCNQQNLLAPTNVITPSNANALFVRLGKRSAPTLDH